MGLERIRDGPWEKFSFVECCYAREFGYLSEKAREIATNEAARKLARVSRRKPGNKTCSPRKAK